MNDPYQMQDGHHPIRGTPWLLTNIILKRLKDACKPESWEVKC